MTQPLTVRVGIPTPGGRLLDGVRDRGYPSLVSANAFARSYPSGHQRAGDFRSFRLPDPQQFADMDVALDSAGFVAAARYGSYRWTVCDYFDLVESYPWAWYAAMDFCVEPEIARDRERRLLRIAHTAHLLACCRHEAQLRNLPPPVPVLQGWTPEEYALCAEWLPLPEWPDLVGVGSMCRRNVHGPDGILAVLATLDDVLPPHTKLHLFGVKSAALAHIAHHPRVVSTDSMAWDMQARVECRTGRTTDVRLAHLTDWMTKQQRIIKTGESTSLQHRKPAPTADLVQVPEIVQIALEALALQFADLVRAGEMSHRLALVQMMRDSEAVYGLLVNAPRMDAALYRDLDDVFEGLGERMKRCLRRVRSS